MNTQKILEKLSAIEGDTAVAIAYLDGSKPFYKNEHAPFVAASVIKLAVMLEAFRRFEDGTLSKDALFTVKPENKLPSCGALTYMHDGLAVTALDLVTLMIIVSDNTATNMLIDLLGIESINDTLKAHGFNEIILRRKLFQPELSRQGIQNTVTAHDVLRFFILLYKGELLGEKADGEMLSILKDQRLNGKMPFFLHAMDIDVAHKTGEDDGITHDAGIIYASTPCAAVFLSEHVNVAEFERFIQDTCLMLV